MVTTFAPCLHPLAPSPGDQEQDQNQDLTPFEAHTVNEIVHSIERNAERKSAEIEAVADMQCFTMMRFLFPEMEMAMRMEDGDAFCSCQSPPGWLQKLTSTTLNCYRWQHKAWQCVFAVEFERDSVGCANK